MSATRQKTGGLWWIFRWPLVLGLASMFGLVSALVGDGLYDVLSWTALGLMVVVMIGAWRGWRATPLGKSAATPSAFEPGHTGYPMK